MAPCVNEASDEPSVRLSADRHASMIFRNAQCSSRAMTFIGLFLCAGLGIQQVRGEHLLKGEEPLGDPLFEVIAKHFLQSLAIRLDATGPPVLPQDPSVFINQVIKPGKHDVHVVEDVQVLVLRHCLVLASQKAW